MKITHFAIAILLFSLFLLGSRTYSVFADFPEGSLDEDVNLDTILSDIPPDFDFTTASKSEFSSLPYFSPADAELIVSVRDSLLSHGDMNNYIVDVPELSPFQSSILWYLQSRTTPNVHRTSSNPVNAVYFDKAATGNCRTGYSLRPPTSVAQGKYYFKTAAVRSGHYSFSILAERDANEQRAVDSYSAYLELILDKGRSKVILGDFRPGYAQGLIFSRYGRSYANGIDTFSSDTKNQGNTAFEETLYLRGLLINTTRGPASIQLFSSVRRLDASMDENGKATVIDISGLHVGGCQRDNLTETIQGGHVSLKWGTIGELSVTGAVSQYSPSLAQRDGEEYMNDLSGNSFVHTGIAGNIDFKPLMFFFEHAILHKSGSTATGGIEIKKQNAGASFLYRDYSTDYWSRHAGGFSSFGDTSNERGLYSSVEIKLPLSSRFSASLDLARLMSRTYSRILPDTRMRACFSLQKYFSSSYTGIITVRSVQDDETNTERKNLRFSWEKKPNHSSPFGWKTLTVWSESEGKGGPFFSSSLTVRGKRFLNLKCTAGLFSIPNYDSRLYIPEESVPGQSYTMPLWGRGETASILLAWYDVSFRYRIIHSDLMRTNQECTVQCDIQF
ncbi:MAG: hypothetical protein WCU00_01090 [Candidatus Latescibacterota bacterium]